MPQDVNDDLMATAIGGLTALTDDHPEIFWMSGFQAGFGFSYLIKDDGTMDIMISALSIAITLNTAAYSSWDEVFSTYHEMLAAVEAFPVRGFTRYEKLKSMHDGIASQVVYDPNLGTAGENPTDHEPTSVFLEPFTTVCEGYSEAFQLLCQREGIPCITVVGTANGGGHAWNYVQMEDGVWYAVDLTWDDQGDIMNDFFLVGSQTQNYYFEQTTFSGSHVPNGQRFITDLFALSYPALSRTAYCGVLSNGNTDVVFNRSKSMLIIAFPIVIGALANNISSLIDVLTVQQRLESVVAVHGDEIYAMYGASLDGVNKVPDFLFGCYKGYSYSFYNLVPTIASVIGISALPAVATAWSGRDRAESKKSMESVIRMTALISFPGGIGLWKRRLPGTC